MTEREPINAPLLAGWTIATGMALAAFGVSLLVMDLGANGSAAVAIVIWLVVGLILGMPRRELQPPNSVTRVAAPAAATATHAPAASTASSAAADASAAEAAATPATPVPPARDATDTRPIPLPGPRGGAPDDLKQIKGIGPALESMLHQMGYYHYDQIAAWTEAEIAWVDENMEGFRGRASRDGWVAQAKVLVAGGSVDNPSGSN